MKRKMRPLSRSLLALATFAATLIMPRSAGAQAGTTTGAIRGQVAEQSGTPITGAQVSATNLATGFTRNALSGDAGLFSLALLPPGRYRVSVRFIGFTPAQEDSVSVTVGSTTPVNFRLQAAATQLAAVQVTGQTSQINTTQGGVAQTVTEAEIANLPTLGRDFTDFINLSGLVSPLPEVTTGGQFSIGGARPSQTNVQVDGVDANNAFFGENRGGSRIPFVFSLESIREFQIVTNGFDVEYGNYSGGVVNVVTKSGTNDLKGTVYANHRGKALTRRGFDGEEARDFRANQYAAEIEGPFVRDKLHFVFSLDGQKRSEPFQPISPTNLSDPDEAVRLSEFFDILQNVYGVPNAAASFNRFSTKNDVITFFGRIDWTMNDKHRLTVRNNFADHNNGNETFAGVVRGGLSRAEAFKDKSNSIQAELTSALTPSMFNTLRVQYAFEDRPREGNDLKPTLQVSPGGGFADFTYGGNFISFNNFLGERKLQLIDNVSWALGDHLFKVGTNNIFADIENRFWLNGSGTFEFRNLDDFRNGIASRFNRNVRRDGSAPTAQFTAQEYSFYAQDQWQMTPRLLGTLGLRYDVARYGDRPGRVVDVERAFGIQTGNAPIDNNNISPRLSFAYDLNGDARSVLRAGAGLFYGRVPYVMGSNVAITDEPLLVIDCRGSIADGDPTAPPNPLEYRNWSSSGADNPATCASASSLTGVPEYSFWRDDFELPETWKFNVGYERRLTDRSRFSTDLIYSRSSKLYTVRNLNLRDPQFTLASEGGRQIFVPEASFAPAGAAGTARLRNIDFANVYMNYNDGAAQALAATFELDHRLSPNVNLRGSYTFTSAHDNSSFYCCTSNEGFRTPRIGALGPNVIGESGDESAGWGPSDFVRNHVIILWGDAQLPLGFQVSAIVRMQSGTPWTPEQAGDLNGDGERFNDRLYIFAPDELPVFVASNATNPDSVVAAQRARYAGFLSEHSCVGEHVGKIIPRNTCRQPWFNRFDLSIRKRFDTIGQQGALLYIDLFNVLNAINSDWGQYHAVTAANRNLLAPQGYEDGKIEYTVPTTFGSRQALGSNLVLQASAQIGLRYFF
jgi:hypothetical protein